MSQYFFIRLPKCGSTSVMRAFEDAAESSKHKYLALPGLDTRDRQTGFIESLRSKRKVKRALYKYFGVITENALWEKVSQQLSPDMIMTGHTPYRKIGLSTEPLRVISLMRDPFDRFVSDYKWAKFGYSKRGPIRRLYHSGRIAAADGSLSDYFDFMQKYPEHYQNELSKYLVPEGRVGDALGFIREHYFAFGTIEHLDAFQRVFAERSGIEIALKHSNKSPLDLTVSYDQGLLRAFREFNAVDYALFDEVSERHVL